MKRLLWIVAGFAVLGCQESETAVSEFTGNEVAYSLQSGSVYDISGTITFKERKDGTAQAVVMLKGTEGDLQHPVHLHLGNISAPDADIAALLNPVVGKTGISETRLTALANEEPITFDQLIDLNACIKIHLSDVGPERDIILAAGNIGKAVYADPGGRYGISVCKSE